MEGKLNPVAAYTTGKLKVEGNLDKALELQKITFVKPETSSKTRRGKQQKIISE